MAAHCTNCKYKWKRKNVWQLGFSKKGKACPNCNTTQYISFKDRNLLMGLAAISGTVTILLLLFFPFFFKLSDNEESMWWL
ncbi:hypothetical protein VBD025_16475 [Virgibacillus flavescens]|uniref:hypothetical protein n=1 Tax=Virgibacillus flavescens TaxID=1611422 RepID=UPI003D33466A